MHDEAMCSHESGDGGLAVLQRGEMALVKVVTCSAPVNIAVIKYCKSPHRSVEGVGLMDAHGHTVTCVSLWMFR